AESHRGNIDYRNINHIDIRPGARFESIKRLFPCRQEPGRVACKITSQDLAKGGYGFVNVDGKPDLLKGNRLQTTANVLLRQDVRQRILRRLCIGYLGARNDRREVASVL
ncbi:hypothetical protein pipiens_020147, partial [Culex pipiens pipiens]